MAVVTIVGPPAGLAYIQTDSSTVIDHCIAIRDGFEDSMYKDKAKASGPRGQGQGLVPEAKAKANACDHENTRSRQK